MSSITIATKAPRPPAGNTGSATSKPQGQDEFSRMVADASDGRTKRAEQGTSGTKGPAATRGNQAKEPDDLQAKASHPSQRGDPAERAVGMAKAMDGGEPAQEADAKDTGETSDKHKVGAARAGLDGTPVGGAADQDLAEAASYEDRAQQNQAQDSRAQENQAQDSRTQDSRTQDSRTKDGQAHDGWPGDGTDIDIMVSPTALAPAAAVLAVAPFLTAKAAFDKHGEASISQRGATDGNKAPAARSVPIEAVATARAAAGNNAAQRDDLIQAAFGRSAQGEGGSASKAAMASGDRGGQMAAQMATAIAGPATGASPPMPATDATKASIPTIPVDLGRLPGRDADGLGATRELIASHVTRVAAMPNPGQPTPVLRLQLQPVHLGQINVTMRMVDGAVSVQLTPDSETAARALATDRDSIVAAVRSLGGSFANASIEVGGDTQLRQGGDDGAQSRNAGSDLREGGDNGSNRSGDQTHAGGRNDDPSIAADQGATASSGNSRIII